MKHSRRLTPLASVPLRHWASFRAEMKKTSRRSGIDIKVSEQRFKSVHRGSTWKNGVNPWMEGEGVRWHYRPVESHLGAHTLESFLAPTVIHVCAYTLVSPVIGSCWYSGREPFRYARTQGGPGVSDPCPGGRSRHTQDRQIALTSNPSTGCTHPRSRSRPQL